MNLEHRSVCPLSFPIFLSYDWCFYAAVFLPIRGGGVMLLIMHVLGLVLPVIHLMYSAQCPAYLQSFLVMLCLAFLFIYLFNWRSPTCNYMSFSLWSSHGLQSHIICLELRITESFRFKKAFEIIESNP